MDEEQDEEDETGPHMEINVIPPKACSMGQYVAKCSLDPPTDPKMTPCL